MNIIFMGTPAFALPTLKKLIDSPEHHLAAIFTQSPKAQGRGLKISKSPVHLLAEQYDIPIFTPTSLKKPELLQLIDSINADIIIVIAYGFIIPAAILKAKKYGCLNIHPSKLPQYRGAAPLQRTIINGESESAVCIMQMDEGLDTGDIILQQNISLDSRITLPELHNQAAEIGGNLLLKTLANIEKMPRIPQSTINISYADKLSKSESLINWQADAFKIDSMIRGMNPWPGAHFLTRGKKVNIIEATYRKSAEKYPAGQILNKKFEIACGQDILCPQYLKPEGKSKLAATNYFNGNHHLKIGDILK